jgi:hypothetical protein
MHIVTNLICAERYAVLFIVSMVIFLCLVLSIIFLIALFIDKTSGTLRQHPDQFWSDTQIQGANYSGQCKGQRQDWQPDNQEWNVSF